MKVLYGVFDNRASAVAAVESLDLPTDRWNAVVHTTSTCARRTSSSAEPRPLRGAVLGGLVVGLCGALAAVFILWPMQGCHCAWLPGLAMVLAGSLFGVVAGGVAGASECKSTIREEVGYAERRGKVIVTYELERRRDSERVIEAFEARGAEHVRAA